MIHFFSNHKIIFKLTNLVLLIVYLYPGSLAGFFIYNDFTKQPQLTPDFLTFPLIIFMYLQLYLS